MEPRINPLLRTAAQLLSRRDYRVTSIYRPGGRSGSHGTGDAMDIAHMLYGWGKYDLSEARSLHDFLSQAIPHTNWAVIAEDDHFHIEPGHSLPFVGRKNQFSNNQLEITQMSRARMPVSEWGDATAPDAPATSSNLLALPSVSDTSVHKLAASLQYPDRNPGLVRLAAVQSPAALDKARQIATLRDAVTPPVKWVDVQNGRAIADSLGAGSFMQNGDIQALVKDIANGMPVFEPQIFPFTPLGPTLFQFFPSFALDIGNGGPLSAGQIYKWIASHIRISNSILSAQPGIQAQMTIEFAPAGPGAAQSLIFELGDATIPTILSPVHGAIAAGYPRMQSPLLAVQAGVPVPGVDFPRVTVSGLPTASYQVVYRFMVPGDAPTDRFRAYMS